MEWSPDWLSAVAAVLALAVTAVIAVVTLVQQRRLSAAALSEQRALATAALKAQSRIAHDQRLWEARSTLYVDVLVWLEERQSSLERLRKALAEGRHERDMASLRRLMTDIHEGTLDPSGEQPDAELGRLQDFDRVLKHLEPPVALRERLQLYASKHVQQAFLSYRMTQALPEAYSDDVGGWSRSLHDASLAGEAFRDVIVEEIRRFTTPTDD